MLTLARIRCFATFGRTGWCDPLGVSKRSVVELSEKDQEIALAEYSRLVVLFLVIGHICPSYGRSKVKFSEIL